ncbi:BglG family transcription antiterminator [Agathobacter rectalis]|uniref:BglG family transcription antiterminator n=1 Tax=Agathobacter rectalis TaxID=39491 RepID=UPI0027D201B8|nr:PTS sugar transporter subunit IIA [Agathobacter rectalis]MCB7111623.1 PTS sugar transporter subunit IIA [Agathobacter rectalis]MCG4814817.1 PTS sugar transporter subunit IIA [Agathobacter rectalis]
MLSEKGLLIIEKLAEHNNELVTSKALAASTGMSERSVKTYLKEVADFCEQNSMVLDRKPGKGMKPCFSDAQIGKILDVAGRRSAAVSQKKRQNYISYILLSGWDTYTYALFSEELNVSKNVIMDDINELDAELLLFGIKVHRTAGYGIYATGSELDIRKAMRHFCRYPISDKQVIKTDDHRLSRRAAEVIANNFRSVNLSMSVDMIHHVERRFDIIFTDYTFQMLAEYIAIALFRVDVEKELKPDELDLSNQKNRFIMTEHEHMAREAADFLERHHGISLAQPEIMYLAMLFSCAEGQNRVVMSCEEALSIEDEMIVYLSNLLAANLIENELLRESMRSFLPGSIARTHFGIEIDNPFLSDITQSYASLFTVCFTVSRYYEKYTGAMPSENEIAFIALQVGGALHRNPMTVRAVLIGAAGYATGSIIAGKIENRVPDVRIVSILSSDRIEHIDEYDCDLILSTIDTQADIHKDMRFLYVSPLISAQDEKNIRNKCFELMTGQSAEVSEFSQMLSEEFIIFEKKAKNRKDVLKRACQLLINKGIVQSEFARDVLEREKVEATAVGCNIAIPHGKPEHVNRCQILVIRLDKPIEWGERMADMIFLLAINFDSVNTTKAFFHDFTKLLNENGATDRLREAASPHELCAAIRKELGWN